MPTRIFRLFCLYLTFCLFSCQRRTKTISFYYWNPTFTLDSTEGEVLQNNDVHILYIRYLDVDWTPADSAPVPLTPFNLTRYDRNVFREALARFN